MNAKFFLASAAALVIATPAMAQDGESGFKGGPRIEARVGIDDVVMSVFGDSGSKAGLTYGGEIGYDYATSSGFVIGAYAGIEGSTTKECEGPASAETCLKAGRNITAGVRAGAVVGNGLLYAKGGYSNGRASVTNINTHSPASNFSADWNLDGFHLGAGYELPISTNTYAKIEYVYTNYNTANDLGVDVGVQRHQGLVGFGFRF